MFVIDKKNSHFIDIVENDDYASYLVPKSMECYRKEELVKLIEEYHSVYKKYKRKLNAYKLSMILGKDSLVKRCSFELEIYRQKLRKTKNNIDIFEAKLAYLILDERILFPKSLGYTDEYIENLLNEKSLEEQNTRVEYYYWKSTNRTSELIKDKSKRMMRRLVDSPNI